MTGAPVETLALDLPLRDCQLIEASAGTGKTFTIALLYVRLVLGPRPAHSDRDLSRPLLPPDILVVTFTEAASLELRDRIRERLVQAAAAFRAADAGDELARHDPLLARLRDAYPVDAWAACAHRLDTAADWMDDAAISTIHGWAQRMLREHAFDSGKPFRQEINQDISALRREAVVDYWRSRLYRLPETTAGVLVDLLGSPDALHRRLRPLLAREGLEPVFRGEPVDAAVANARLRACADLAVALRDAEAAARAVWAAECEALEDTLHALRPAMNGTVFQKVKDDAVFAGWLRELRAWGQGELALADAPFVQRLATERFKLKKGVELPASPFFPALQAWADCAAEEADARVALLPPLLAEAREAVALRLEEALAQRAEMGFDDLIRGLDRALQGAGGAVLAERLRGQFPVALIDEFQDTDPGQYRIFQRVYGLGEPAAPDTAATLVLIGDPKQAIYGFRGGDIHTYLQAREAIAGRPHTLGTNFRSSRAMVDAVNALFGRAERDAPRAAFRFAGETGDNPLPFYPVRAAGRRETLQLDGCEAPALTGCLLPLDADEAGLDMAGYRRRASRHCANAIAGWLNQAEAGQAGFSSAGGDSVRPLRAGDIAVLVRDRGEAAAIRAALAERGLASVYLSDRESVFATPQARDMLLWLRAMATPESVADLRAALATASLGLSLSRLESLQREEWEWERVQLAFLRYRDAWQRRGVLPALRALLHDFEVPSRLSAGADSSERALTNLLHLAEWAQQASASLDGEHALIRALSAHIADPERDEQILRLESDADLIQVVTLFKSKGLEYPLVALPFACGLRRITGRFGTPVFHEGHAALLELDTSAQRAEESYRRADDERLSEELRLLYVGLTRARYATWLGLAPLVEGKGKKPVLHHAALGYLLAGGALPAGGDEIPDRATLRSAWEAMADGTAGIVLQDGGYADTVYRGAPQAPPRKPARTVAHRAFAPWWVASYSSLRHAGHEAPETFAAEMQAEVRGEERPHPEDAAAGPAQAESREPGTEPGSLHAFPRGPEPGTFLHTILEDAANAGFAAVLGQASLLAGFVARCRDRGWEAHEAALTQGLARWLATPLAPRGEAGPVLADLQRYRAEPDFWFATGGAQTQALDALLCAHVFPGAERPRLQPETLRGLMKGFIDLLFEHEGRFYVADWKSNWLGADDTAYTADALQAAALDKRYDLQLALYLVALHRHLKHSLADYDYEQHVGGAMLVFLRGIDAPSRGVLALKPPRDVIEALDDCLAGVAGREDG